MPVEDMLVLEEFDCGESFCGTCEKCKNSSIVFVSRNQSGIASIGMATDLEKNEVKEKFFGKTISADEIIDIHQYISVHSESLLGFIKKH